MKHRRSKKAAGTRQPDNGKETPIRLAAELDEEQIDQLFSIEWTGQSIPNRDAVVASLTAMSKRIQDMLGPCFWESAYFTAIEMLLYAESANILDWKQLRLLILHGIDVGMCWEDFGESPLEAARQGGIAGWDGPQYRDYYVRGFTRFAKEAFFGCIEGICGLLAKSSDKRSLKMAGWDGTLAKSYRPQSHQDVIQQQHRVWVVETELLADEEFRTALVKEVGRVNTDYPDRKWEYHALNARLLVADDDNMPPLKWTSVKYDSYSFGGLPKLCRTWCLESVSNFQGSSEIDGAFFSVARPTIKVRRDGLGFDLFIPRFYSFNHIHNYADRDFKPAKMTMTNLFDAGRLQTNKKAKYKVFKSLFQCFQRKGSGKLEAYDRAAKTVRLSPSTLKSLGATRPSARNQRPHTTSRRLHRRYQFADAADAVSVVRTRD